MTQTETIISRLFPETILTMEANPQTIQGQIYLEEQALIENAIDKRKDEFTAGRVCAHKLLAQLGIKNAPVLAGENRMPIWPQGIVGSITHTKEYCAVALTNNSEFKSIGLDAEYIERVKENIWKVICTENELKNLQTIDQEQRQKNATLIFSAKECFFKCQFPLTKEWVDFQDVEIAINNEKETFSIIPIKASLSISNPEGRFTFNEKYVFTGMIS